MFKTLALVVLVFTQDELGKPHVDSYVVDSGLSWEDCKAKAASRQHTLSSGESLVCEPDSWQE